MCRGVRSKPLGRVGWRRAQRNPTLGLAGNKGLLAYAMGIPLSGDLLMCDEAGWVDVVEWFGTVSADGYRPTADCGHAAKLRNMANSHANFLLASFRVSGATLKQNRELRMSKESYQAHKAKNMRPLVSSTYS